MKKLAALLLVLVMTFSCFSTVFALSYGSEWANYTSAQTATYSDVPSSHWAFNAVERSTATNWFSGYPDGTFRPDASIKRGEAMKVFVTFLGLQLSEVTNPSYYDVNATDWYAPYIEAGKKLFPARTQFNGQTPFQPEMPITREDAIYALVIALKYNDKVQFADQSILNMFSDANSISALVKPYAAVAIEKGLVSGHSNGTIGGQDPLTRAQFATLLYRASTIGFGTGGGLDAVPDTTPEAPTTPSTPETPSTPVVTTGDVTGMVVDASDRTTAIAGATVTFSNGTTATTDAAGKYTVTGVTAGTYTITAAKDGYTNAQVSVNVTANTANTADTIYLTKNAPVVTTGVVDGMVADASNRTTGIAGATVTFSNGTTATTDAAGKYNVTLPSGDYTVTATKEGYTQAQINITVAANTTNYAETMYLALPIEDGSIEGTVQDAFVQNGVVAGATLNFREGGDNKTGDIKLTVTSAEDGTYTAELPSGSYTVEAIKDGYVTAYKNVTSTADGSTEDISMTPVMPEGQIRIVLSWGETPRDLDSHLTGPKADGTRFHVAYYDSNAYDGSVNVANLDRDDIDSYGPETVTIYEQRDGTYRYSIHDYTNRYSTTSDAMSKSGAKVELYKGSILIATYNMPTNVVGTVWTVFELNGDVVTPINTISTESNPSALTGSAGTGNDIVSIANAPAK